MRSRVSFRSLVSSLAGPCWPRWRPHSLRRYPRLDGDLYLRSLRSLWLRPRLHRRSPRTHRRCPRTHWWRPRLHRRCPRTHRRCPRAHRRHVLSTGHSRRRLLFQRWLKKKLSLSDRIIYMALTCIWLFGGILQTLVEVQNPGAIHGRRLQCLVSRLESTTNQLRT